MHFVPSLTPGAHPETARACREKCSVPGLQNRSKSSIRSITVAGLEVSSWHSKPPLDSQRLPTVLSPAAQSKLERTATRMDWIRSSCKRSSCCSECHRPPQHGCRYTSPAPSRLAFSRATNGPASDSAPTGAISLLDDGGAGIVADGHTERLFESQEVSPRSDREQRATVNGSASILTPRARRSAGTSLGIGGNGTMNQAVRRRCDN